MAACTQRSSCPLVINYYTLSSDASLGCLWVNMTLCNFSTGKNVNLSKLFSVLGARLEEQAGPMSLHARTKKKEAFNFLSEVRTRFSESEERRSLPPVDA